MEVCSGQLLKLLSWFKSFVMIKEQAVGLEIGSGKEDLHQVEVSLRVGQCEGSVSVKPAMKLVLKGFGARDVFI